MPGVAERLRELRRERGLSQEELGKRVGVSARVVWTWEAGRNQMAADDISRVAKALGVGYEALLEGGAEPQAPDPRRMRGGQTISDYVAGEMERRWGELTEADQRAVTTIVDALVAWRHDLLAQEGLAGRERANA